MRIGRLWRQNKFTLSFEVFPPVREGNVEALYKTISELSQLRPDFISVTYGAGGSTRDMSMEIAAKVKNEISQEVLAHLTCVQSAKEDIAAILTEMEIAGIENILALRGDPPQGQDRFERTAGGFGFACELVEFIKSEGDFCIGVAGYPEGHIEAENIETDLVNLKRKVDAGADFIITQMFFENDHFYRFRDRAIRQGIKVPLIPGVFPVLNYRQVMRCISLSRATMPAKLEEKMMRLEGKTEETEKFGIEYAIHQITDLLRNEVDGLHIYSMNRSAPVLAILNEITLPGKTRTFKPE
ncbi:MAG: methylenetetrahydrofolate reductase [NAD(P)H] [Smithellaceae bacterium]|nr:methylenetetrahydrofolate reductase [NAD(P)H] [Smithellaceae bacterium]